MSQVRMGRTGIIDPVVLSGPLRDMVHTLDDGHEYYPVGEQYKHQNHLDMWFITLYCRKCGQTIRVLLNDKLDEFNA